MIFSQDKALSIMQLYKYTAGVMLLFAGASLNSQETKNTILIIIISGVIISFIAIYQYLFGFSRLLEYITKEGITDPYVKDCINQKRVFAPFINPNALGGYLAMTIALVLALKRRLLFIIPLALALLMTKSLGAILSLFSGVTLWYYLKKKLNKRTIAYLAALFIAITLIFLSRQATAKEYLSLSFSALTRIDYWKDTLRIILIHPIIGAGIGCFGLYNTEYAHNLYLQMWAENGILGLISFLWLIFAVLKTGLQEFRSDKGKMYLASIVSSCVIFLVHNFADFTFYLPEISLIWWLQMGLCLPREENKLPIPENKTDCPRTENNCIP